MDIKNIKTIIPSKEALSTGLIKSEYVEQWPYVAILFDGSAMAMRFR
jgi:hypothetical protein